MSKQVTDYRPGVMVDWVPKKSQGRRQKVKKRVSSENKNLLEEYFKQGKAVTICPVGDAENNKLQFSSGHFHPRKSKLGSQRRKW